MLTYNLEERGSVPLYQYLYSCIRNDIRNDILKTNEKLPSKRALSQHLGVSIMTVQNAYEQLLLEGYLYSEEKKGYFVSDLVRQAPLPPKADEASPDITDTAGQEGEAHKYLVDFASNHVAADQFPAATWARLMRQTLSDREAGLYQTPPPTGVYKLRSAIALHLRSYGNLQVNPDNIIIGAGTEYLYGLIVQLLGHNRMVAVENPGHTKITRIYESNGLRVLHIPVDKKGIRVDKLEGNHVSCVHISPSHHFPLGLVMPADRRYQLIAWARSHGAYIIEDDYDSEFRFTGRPIPAMAGIAPDRVIYMNTFSRTLLPSIRIAYMVLPDSLKQRFDDRLGFYSSTVSSFDQYTLARFISEGYYGRHINRMCSYYKKTRDRLFCVLRESPLYDIIDIEEENAGLHFIMHIKAEISDQVYLARLENKEIHIRPVSRYCHHHNGEYDHKFIINYSDINEDHLREAFDIMYRAIH